MFSTQLSRLGSLVALSLGLAGAASAQIVTISAFDQGWYDSTGFHDPLNTNYITGTVGDTYRSFFAFDRSAYPKHDYFLTNATVEIYNPAGGYLSASSFEIVLLSQYSGSLASLLNGTGGVAAFNDLGDGTGFGAAVILAPSDDTWIGFGTSAAFPSFLNATDGQFAIGGSLVTLGSDPDAVFAFSQEPFARITLQFVPIPEPSTYGLIGAALLGGLVVWRRRSTRGKA